MLANKSSNASAKFNRTCIALTHREAADKADMLLCSHSQYNWVSIMVLLATGMKTNPVLCWDSLIWVVSSHQFCWQSAFYTHWNMSKRKKKKKSHQFSVQSKFIFHSSSNGSMLTNKITFNRRFVLRKLHILYLSCLFSC